MDSVGGPTGWLVEQQWLGFGQILGRHGKAHRVASVPEGPDHCPLAGSLCYDLDLATASKQAAALAEVDRQYAWRRNPSRLIHALTNNRGKRPWCRVPLPYLLGSPFGALGACILQIFKPERSAFSAVSEAFARTTIS
jgi:hypothetical protein